LTGIWQPTFAASLRSGIAPERQHPPGSAQKLTGVITGVGGGYRGPTGRRICPGAPTRPDQ
jgi:hypothetical protein